MILASKSCVFRPRDRIRGVSSEVAGFQAAWGEKSGSNSGSTCGITWLNTDSRRELPGAYLHCAAWQEPMKGAYSDLPRAVGGTGEAWISRPLRQGAKWCAAGRTIQAGSQPAKTGQEGPRPANSLIERSFVPWPQLGENGGARWLERKDPTQRGKPKKASLYGSGTVRNARAGMCNGLRILVSMGVVGLDFF